MPPRPSAVPHSSADGYPLQRMDVSADQSAALEALAVEVALLATLYHLQDVIAAPRSSDLREAGRLHWQYHLMKHWFFDQALPGEHWESLVKDWPIEEAEAQLFHVYRRLLSSAYNVAQNSETQQPHVAEHIESIAATREAGAFYRVCPAARGAAHIKALSSAATGNPAESPLHVVEGHLPSSMTMLGNALSLYWQARGLALLAGVPFRGVGGKGTGFFVDFLPRTSPVSSHDLNNTNLPLLLRQSCSACSSQQHWRWPHLCLGAWVHVRQSVQLNTISALQQSGAAAAAADLLMPHDVAIHMRCFPFFSDDYPLPALSVLSDLPLHLPQDLVQSPKLRFLLVAGTLGPACRQFVETFEIRLRGLFPQAKVLHLFQTTESTTLMAEDLSPAQAAQRDFALLVLAPVLLRASSSSFSLWAALARMGSTDSSRPVLSLQNPVGGRSAWQWEEAELGSDWTWLRAPLLSHAVVLAENFSFAEPSRWIQWLEEH